MESGGRTARSDLLGGAGWIVFGAAIVAAALRMDRFEAMGATLYTMPGFVPAIFGAVLLLLGAALALRGWRRRSASREAAPAVLNQRVVLMLGLSLLYAIGSIGRVPFWLATPLFIGAFIFLFTDDTRTLPRRAALAAAVAVLATITVVIVFEQIFLVRLP
jgi:uncharacterized membrane protein YhaH (DUF805 family)